MSVGLNHPLSAYRNTVRNYGMRILMLKFLSISEVPMNSSIYQDLKCHCWVEWLCIYQDVFFNINGCWNDWAELQYPPFYLLGTIQEQLISNLAVWQRLSVHVCAYPLHHDAWHHSLHTMEQVTVRLHHTASLNLSLFLNYSLFYVQTKDEKSHLLKVRAEESL